MSVIDLSVTAARPFAGACRVAVSVTAVVVSVVAGFIELTLLVAARTYYFLAVYAAVIRSDYARSAAFDRFGFVAFLMILLYAVAAVSCDF